MQIKLFNINNIINPLIFSMIDRIEQYFFSNDSLGKKYSKYEVFRKNEPFPEIY